MQRYTPKLRAIAIGYAALAGFVDAIGFLKSGGMFVSFMSGNSTRLAIGLAELTWAAIGAASLIALFVAGVVANRLVSMKTGTARKTVAAGGVALILACALVFEALDWNTASIASLCLAMGASNTIFERDGEVSIGLTYMTGTLVKAGYRIAEALRGGDPYAWISYFLLWAALVAGGICGALCYQLAPMLGLTIAAVTAALLGFLIHLNSREAACN